MFAEFDFDFDFAFGFDFDFGTVLCRRDPQPLLSYT